MRKSGGTVFLLTIKLNNHYKQLKGLKLFFKLKIIGQVAPITLRELSLNCGFHITPEDFADFCKTSQNRNAFKPLAFDLERSQASPSVRLDNDVIVQVSQSIMK